VGILKKLIVSILLMHSLSFTVYAACIMPSYATIDPETLNITILSACYQDVEYDIELHYDPVLCMWFLFSLREVRR